LPDASIPGSIDPSAKDSCFHDGGHGAGTEDHGEQTGSKGAPALEEDSDQDWEAGNREADDRHMVDRKVQVGWGEQGCHA
jgi:hypothetical protein